VTGGWRKIHNEELHKLYSSPNIIRRMIWVRHVVCMGEMRNVYTILIGKPEGRTQLKDLGIDGKIILKWILRIWCWRLWIGLSVSG
jgi:hypothetical protein